MVTIVHIIVHNFSAYFSYCLVCSELTVKLVFLILIQEIRDQALSRKIPLVIKRG